MILINCSKVLVRYPNCYQSPIIFKNICVPQIIREIRHGPLNKNGWMLWSSSGKDFNNAHN